MAPAQHLDWLEDNIGWFLDLPASSLDEPVPACPGWTVENVITHLTYGLGLAYPFALTIRTDCPHDQAFADVPWPSSLPTGIEVLTEFDQTMNACLALFRRTSPTTPSYTYEGPGFAAFWFRRAAIETTLHRMDIVEALHLGESAMTDERAADAVAEAATFALPLAAQMTAADPPAVVIRVGDLPTTLQLGSGVATAEISGDATAILAALWGRSSTSVRIDGDESAAHAWMSLVEQAFAGR